MTPSLRLLRSLGLALLAGPFACPTVNAAEQAKNALDFELPGREGFIRLSAQPPGLTLINFWRSDCPPCVRELPLLADTARQTGLRLIAVALQRPQETAGSPVDVQAALRSPTLLLHGPSTPQGLLARFGNRSGALPHTVLLDRDRRPCAQRTGEVDATWLSAALQRCQAT